MKKQTANMNCSNCNEEMSIGGKGTTKYYYCENCNKQNPSTTAEYNEKKGYANAIDDVEKIVDRKVKEIRIIHKKFRMDLEAPIHSANLVIRNFEELKQEIARLHHSPQLNKPTGFDSSSCLRREHNSRVIGTQNSLGEKSAVSPEDTIQKLGTNVKGQTAPNPADANELRKNIKLLGEWVNLNSAEGEK